MRSHTLTRTVAVAVLALGLAAPAASAQDAGGSSWGAMALPGGQSVKVGLGWSWIDLPDIVMTSITDWSVENVLDKITDHDGDFDGLRVDMEVDGIWHKPLHNGAMVSLAFDAFYARFESTRTSQCDFVGVTTDCVIVPIIDTPDQYFTTGGFFSRLRTTTTRELTHWGAALEARVSRGAYVGGSLKDTPILVRSPWQWKLGLGARGLDQEVRLRTVDVGLVADPVDYSESLDATYLGGFVGAVGTWDLGNGFALLVDGDIGYYYVDVAYRGSYQGQNPNGTVFVSQSLALDADDTAFVGALKIELKKDFGWAALGIFAEGEWYSWVPKMLYNDYDLAGGPPFDLVGFQQGTVISSDDAFVYTLGGRVTIPLDEFAGSPQ